MSQSFFDDLQSELEEFRLDPHHYQGAKIMARYLETAEQCRSEIQSLVKQIHSLTDGKLTLTQEGALAVQLGHIVNLAVRCNPRQSQGTVRKNIVATAVKDYCNVTMTKEYDEKTDREFNKIHITAK